MSERPAVAGHGGSLGGDELVELVRVADPFELDAVEWPEVVFVGDASMSAIAPGLADKPRRRWYTRDDLGVAPFVVRTGVN